MLMNAKALVALKAEMQQEAEVIWGSDEYEHHCTMQFEPRRTFDDQMEGMGEIMSAGFEDMEDSLVDIVRGVKRVACAASAPRSAGLLGHAVRRAATVFLVILPSGRFM
jgi:hypothetical protein